VGIGRLPSLHFFFFLVFSFFTLRHEKDISVIALFFFFSFFHASCIYMPFTMSCDPGLRLMRDRKRFGSGYMVVIFCEKNDFLSMAWRPR